jgi:hypothetical protein
LGAALGHLAQAEAQGVALDADGLHAGQLRLGVALALDQLAADLGGGEPAIQPGSLQGGVGLAVVLSQGPDVLQEVGQVVLGGLAAAAAGGGAGDAAALLMEGLADGVAAPAEEAVGLALAEAQVRHGAGDVAAALGADEGVRGPLDVLAHRRAQFHGSAS